MNVLNHLDFARINPISGPIYVDGAKPGDSLKVTLLSFEPSVGMAPRPYRAAIAHQAAVQD